VRSATAKELRLSHRIYPYLLRGLTIDRRNHVWATDITYIPMARGFVYLTAVMDWFARRILAWRLSNTMEASFCIDAVEEALAKHGCPQIFNTDQGSQFTRADFTGMLAGNAIAISMDGKGAWRDNVFVERLWRTVKYEEVYLLCTPMTASARRNDRSAATSPSTTQNDLTQPLTAAPRSSLLRPAAAPHGSLTPADDPLSNAKILFKGLGPPQTHCAFAPSLRKRGTGENVRNVRKINDPPLRNQHSVSP
jgi:transposase InsO family protein